MKANRRMNSDLQRRSLFGNMACIGCIALVVSTASVQSEELTVRSGSKTITIQSGASDFGSRTITADDFAREMLNAHNDVRGRVGLPPLQWSEDLAAYSQKWANSLIANNRTAHNSKSPYGENILSSGLGSTPASVVTEWASESQNYTYSTNTCNGDCGHYTQLVWRNTRKVGCATAHNNQREIWVCSYDPAGNVRGKWPY
jgi:pathogenesis-related protein 1